MDLFQAIVLGLVQGLTEFLPVSSSGHLVLFQLLFGIKKHDIIFDVAVHLGTVLSILTIYNKILRETIISSVQGVLAKKSNSALRLIALLIAGSLPTAIIGLSLKETFEKLFSSPNHVGIFFCVTGILLFLTKKKSQQGQFSKDINVSDANQITFKQAIIVGIAQGAAIAPGISRSGATIAAGILMGMQRNSAAMFSFVMSVPAIMGAAVLQLRHINDFDSDALTVLGVGAVSAYLSGLLGLFLIIKIVGKGRLEVFSYYLWILGPGVLIWL